MTIYRFRRYDQDPSLPASTLIALTLLTGWTAAAVGICRFMGWL